jgi:Anti-sigma-K factor rskA
MSTDDCRAMRGELAAVALDRADEPTRLHVRAHVDSCAECREALDELSVTARALPAASLEHLQNDAVPSSDLVERIARSVRTERRAAERSRRRRVASTVLGAAAALVIALFGVVVWRADDAPALQSFAVAPVGASAAFGLSENDQGTQILLRHHGLDPNRVYWMWLTDAEGQRYNAGSFRGTMKDETIKLQSALPLEQTVRVWCTDAETDVVLDSWVQR